MTSKSPTAEIVGAKILVGIKDYELLQGDDLANACKCSVEGSHGLHRKLH